MREHFPTPFYEADILPVNKPDKNITKKENYRPLQGKIQKILDEYTSKTNPTTYKNNTA